MTADLKQINNNHNHVLTPTQFSSKLSKTIVGLYLFTFISVSVGTWFALYQNWTVRLEDAHSRLARSASMGNFLVETALNSAAKSLDSTQAAFSKAIQSGQMNQALANSLLRTSYAKFQTFNKTDAFGLLFFVDKHGKLYAQSHGQANTDIDFTDRFYYTALRDNPNTQRAVGPLVLARTTGQWVFHMSVPVYGKNNAFAGVLVQQILEKDIANKLMQYADPNHFEQMMSHFDGNPPSFVYPPPNTQYTLPKEFAFTLNHKKSEMPDLGAHTNNLLMSSATSPTYDLETYATYPMSKLENEFILSNRYLMLYAFIGILFFTAIFYYLHDLSKQLIAAQMSSLHDPLTKLHNRRALDEILPTLLRESMRAQEPVSVLFIDIDHFRYFNDHYGHESGDIALQAVAQALASSVKRPLDFVCRWGGEEFVVVLPKTNRHAAMKVADNILDSVRQIELECTNGDRPRLTVSIGHVTSTLEVAPVEEDLVDEADKAMLQAKGQGRNQRVEYSLKA
jgi:diguanylate cyclase (GGDEF)-like protein